MRRIGRTTAAVLVGVTALLGGEAAASHQPGTGKHKIVYHFNGSDDGDHVKKARAVLGNIQNHVNGVGGWDNIESLVLVIHGDGVLPFIEQGMDPEVRKRYDLLTVGGLRMGVCGNTLRGRRLQPEQFPKDALLLSQGGVTAVMEYQERGYSYVKP